MLINLNKKGDISVTVLVMMVVILCFTSLFIFATNAGASGVKIPDVRKMKDVYSKQEIVGFYLEEVSREAYLKTYYEIALEGDYISSPLVYRKSNGEMFPVFNGFNSNFDSNLKKKFIDNFKESFSKYSFEKDYLVSLRNLIDEEKFSVKFDGDYLILELDSFEFTSSFYEFKMFYSPKIESKIDLRNMNLDSFEDIFIAKEDCKNTKDSVCFDKKLNYFEAKVNDDWVVTLTSKNKFFIGKEFKKIEFSFFM